MPPSRLGGVLPSAESSYNSGVREDLRMSPFELDLDWNPSTPWIRWVVMRVLLRPFLSLKWGLKPHLMMLGSHTRYRGLVRVVMLQNLTGINYSRLVKIIGSTNLFSRMLIRDHKHQTNSQIEGLVRLLWLSWWIRILWSCNCRLISRYTRICIWYTQLHFMRSQRIFHYLFH